MECTTATLSAIELSGCRVTTAKRRRGPVVAVTGAASGVGRAFVARAAESGLFRRVVAIDEQRGDVSDVTWRVLDIRDPLLANRISDIDVLVHLAFDGSLDAPSKERRAFNLRCAQTVLTASAAARVKRVVLVTSAMVYGADAENPVPLPEDSPVAAEPDSGVVGDYLEIESLARRSLRSHPGLSLTVLRPAALVGPGVDTVVTRHFEAPRLLVVKGSLPSWQFCHVDDLVSALQLAALGEVTGVVAVGSEGWLTQEQVEETSGLRRFELPAGLTFGTAQRLHRLGVTPAPATDLHYVVYPWVVDPATLRAAGWKPAWTNEAALSELLALREGKHALVGRRVSGKDATLTAAGATVAVIGTAAIVRRARRRRRR
ncbi:NAD-dependent epimerase/dehydratase family protein [Bailinhaonella thermotolerans]|uniref:NAD-dependent epimerase/dehydratase family protein n=1 Tax=Bailinhaonella thermotolerans TaxID=1070861 RepID=A0A3A4AU50_9ACTN|nr:NAD-dependent epimerase/dehydratase family protein [Bailinhaonella thermotolerans]RJL33520.1 NAD-dependent epimerase/dehydratase family protein [Bailinhaonella thermotolerans]